MHKTNSVLFMAVVFCISLFTVGAAYGGAVAVAGSVETPKTTGFSIASGVD